MCADATGREGNRPVVLVDGPNACKSTSTVGPDGQLHLPRPRRGQTGGARRCDAVFQRLICGGLDVEKSLGVISRNKGEQMRFLLGMVVSIALLLVVVYYVGGVKGWDPSQQGLDARAKITPGMSWKKVFEQNE